MKIKMKTKKNMKIKTHPITIIIFLIKTQKHQIINYILTKKPQIIQLKNLQKKKDWKMIIIMKMPYNKMQKN